MAKIILHNRLIADASDPFVIAEIGHNHQGDLKVALEMIKVAAACGVDAVKFQKRDNRTLYTKEMFQRPYDNENSFGMTYGEHREFLEFGFEEYLKLKRCAEENHVEFMCTAFDLPSVDFLERLGIATYKLASGDVTNIPLIQYIARLQKPIFIATGAATLEETRLAYEEVLKFHNQICLMHTVCTYPTEYPDLNLRTIDTLRAQFPKAIIGYSGHDNGILAASVAYLLGAVVVEKHFTMNHSWKGTDHKFSLEPEGLRKQVRDLARIRQMLGNGEKTVLDIERGTRIKMGKILYAVRSLKAGHVMKEEDVSVKSPGGGIEAYRFSEVIGKRLVNDLPEESMISFEDLEDNVSTPKTKNGQTQFAESTQKDPIGSF
jgi:N-acetylneuraminate synthase/sialic acid synthase